MSKVSHELLPQMEKELQGQSIVFLNAINREASEIYSTALSWICAVGPTTVRFAIDAKSEFVRLLGIDPNVTLTYIGSESAWSLKGRASVRVAQASGLTLKMALLEVAVEEVRDVLFYGGKIVQTTAFTKTYREDLVKKLDEEIRTALLSLGEKQFEQQDEGG